MALGQDRTLSEGLADVWAKLQPNMRQFFIAWLLVMMCGAVKKLATFPMPYIAGQSACVREVILNPQPSTSTPPTRRSPTARIRYPKP